MAPLSGIRILDLSRILAGPWCTQLLADLGADIIKIERPGEGDDTRHWGPPYMESRLGNGARMASYYMAANRGKRSVAIDIAKPDGAALVRDMAAQCDVLIENFKRGGLDRYGLGPARMRAAYPRLIYCSITGYGQDGPYADRPGYDFVIQGAGGLMGLTGEPEGEPMRAGVAVTDLSTGMYACTGILAALYERMRTGLGTHIDVALLDVQVATMANQSTYYLATGKNPGRHGNAHASIVPYEAFPTRGGAITIAAGNDGQFRKLCAVLERPELAEDGRFATNSARVANRSVLTPILRALFAGRERDEVLAALIAGGVPAGPVNTMAEVFADPQVRHRGMAMMRESAVMGEVPGVRCPLRFSETEIGSSLPPPGLGEHTEEVLTGVFGVEAGKVADLRKAGVIG